MWDSQAAWLLCQGFLKGRRISRWKQAHEAKPMLVSYESWSQGLQVTDVPVRASWIRRKTAEELLTSVILDCSGLHGSEARRWAHTMNQRESTSLWVLPLSALVQELVEAAGSCPRPAECTCGSAPAGKEGSGNPTKSWGKQKHCFFCCIEI